MHLDILTENQVELLDTVRRFKRTHYLVGGTAIALHLGHRRSVDFDLFTISKLNKNRIKSMLKNLPFKQTVLFEDYDQVHFLVNQVKLTFFSYPYAVKHPIMADRWMSMPTLLSLAAMKAFALGRRAKWKDYVDLFFILRERHALADICVEAESIFGEQFSAKLFREQLAFHKDIDHTEPVEYVGPSVDDETVKNYLIDKSTEIF